MTLNDHDILTLKRMRMFQALINVEGWKELEKIANEQIANRQKIVNTLAKSMDECFVREGIKGAMIGIALPFDTVRTTIEQGQHIARKQKDDNDVSED